ncbi:MAG: MarR family transcriptional regulator [Sphingomonadales bacterium]|nr:MarR family transcriptional regulator [Sphingomonadales bacterium]
MADPLQSFPGYALRRAASAMMTEFSARLAPLGLRYAETSAMVLIEANPGTTASQLGRMLDIQRANMVPLLNRLETAGLISRQPIDGKSHSLSLTPAGQVRLAEAKTVIDTFEHWLIARVPEEHRPHLKPALDALWLGEG